MYEDRIYLYKDGCISGKCLKCRLIQRTFEKDDPLACLWTASGHRNNKERKGEKCVKMPNLEKGFSKFVKEQRKQHAVFKLRQVIEMCTFSSYLECYDIHNHFTVSFQNTSGEWLWYCAWVAKQTPEPREGC